MRKKPYDVKKIRKEMEKALDENRYEHTLGVAYTAQSLAMCNDVSLKSAEIAGLLHDCAKCIDNDKKIAICKKHHISISDVESKKPTLLHDKVGSFLAMNEYNIHDTDIINAILNHTTGRPGMSTLEKIIFVADYIEPNRTIAPNLPAIRKLAFTDLDAALLKILEDTLAYLHDNEEDIDPMTERTYTYYRDKSIEKINTGE